MKSRLYTRSGDGGMTSLVGGERVAKTSPRVRAYGDIDELNAWIGVVRSHAEGLDNMATMPLRRISNLLFNIGAYLATASPAEAPAEQMLTAADVAEIEGEIDTLTAATPELREFVLPGGCAVASFAHVARTVCRRAERSVLELAETGETVAPVVLEYLNRLSDYLFIFSRYANHFTGSAENTWEK